MRPLGRKVAAKPGRNQPPRCPPLPIVQRVRRIKAVDRKSGKTWWRKKAKARTSHWRYWYLPSGKDGRCKPTTIVYTGPGFTARFKITFKSEGV